jgi:hypothetical protein
MHRRNAEPSPDSLSRIDEGEHRSRVPPNLMWKTAFSVAGFSIVHLALKLGLPLLPGFYEFDSETQRQFVLNVSSCCHHLVVAPWSAYISAFVANHHPGGILSMSIFASFAVFREWRESVAATPETQVDYSRSFKHMIPFTGGYFITGQWRSLVAPPEPHVHILSLVQISFFHCEMSVWSQGVSQRT